MRGMILLAAVILFSALSSQAQDTPADEASAGCSYLRLSLPGRVSQHGGSISVVGNLNHRLGLAADVGRYQAAAFGVALNTYTYLGPPRFSYRKSSHVTVFAQVLMGALARTMDLRTAQEWEWIWA